MQKVYKYWAIIKDGQLKEVVKDEKASPEAEILYNVELQKVT